MKHPVLLGDHISTGGKRNIRGPHQEKEKHLRGFLLPLFLVLFISILLFRLVNLQIFQGVYYRELSDKNRIRTELIHAPRGIIFDRNGTPLIYNIPGFRKTTNAGGEKKTQLLNKNTALLLIAKGEKQIEVDALREYAYSESFSHVLGYIAQISEAEIKMPKYKEYRSGDLIGKMGVEKEFEDVLRGVDGKKLVEVDSQGKAIRQLGQTDPISGRDIILTLDAKLQNTAYNALSGVTKGAVIVSTPQGEVLALVSKPSFDPNLFTMDETYKRATTSGYQKVSEILEDLDNQPFVNRAISGVYPPGSTFKIITAAAGLEEKKIDENFQIDDPGILRIGQFSFRNWYFTQYGRTDGNINVVAALKRSNDIFFYKLADMVGVDVLSSYAKKFGLGNTLGIQLEGEAKGLVPTPEWKKEALGEGWYLGDNYNYGIGQGYLLTTPLQVAGWTQVIASGGVLHEPTIVKNQKGKVKNKEIVHEKTIQLIRQGMIESCAPGGVAWPFYDFKVKNAKLKVNGRDILEAPQATTSANFKDYRKVVVACKTGTAEHGGPTTPPHAWITLFAPAYNPQIVVTVLAESSGEGSNIAAPIAKKVLEEWFSR